MESRSKAFEFYGIRQRLFPLPEGEGQGEGERGSFSFIRKAHRTFLQFAVVAIILLVAITSLIAQQLPQGRATDFTSHSYFEPPNEQKVKMKLTGAEASPLPGGLLDVKRLQVESYALDGKIQMIVRAPQCNYAPLDGVANSAGRLEMQTGDGNFRIEGEGFLWRQDDSTLIISNRVHTVIQAGTLSLSAS